MFGVSPRIKSPFSHPQFTDEQRRLQEEGERTFVWRDAVNYATQRAKRGKGTRRIRVVEGKRLKRRCHTLTSHRMTSCYTSAMQPRPPDPLKPVDRSPRLSCCCLSAVPCPWSITQQKSRLNGRISRERCWRRHTAQCECGGQYVQPIEERSCLSSISGNQCDTCFEASRAYIRDRAIFNIRLSWLACALPTEKRRSSIECSCWSPQKGQV